MKNFMTRKRAKWIALMVGLLFMLITPHTAVVAQTSEITILKQQVRELQAQLEAVQKKLEAVDESVAQNAQAVAAAAEAVEEQGSESSFWDKTSLGGFGELHYNNWSAEDSGSENDNEEIDFHRFVLFFGHEFTERLRLLSEVEIEHVLAAGGEHEGPGEVKLEQAFIEYDFDAHNRARAGVFLLPIGIMNENHEPPTFYGVERNEVEKIIIPTGWSVGGIAYNYRSDRGLSFDLALHEGLKIEEHEDHGHADEEHDEEHADEGPGTAQIREARQNGAKAQADDLAVTGRVKYTGPGLELAAGLQYQSDVTQEGNDDIDDAILYEAHIDYSRGPFALRALYAGWDLDVASNSAIKANDYDQQDGWYIEPSFKMTPNFGVFARYEDVEGGRPVDEFEQWSVGFNYWLNENVVLKADFIDREHDNAADDDFNGFNLGMGFSWGDHGHGGHEHGAHEHGHEH